MPFEQLEHLAALIYTNNVDLNRPLLNKDVAAKSIKAARDFLEYMDSATVELAADKDQKCLYAAYEAYKAGRKVQAIKEMRAGFGYGLKEAKDIVDGWTERPPVFGTVRR